MSPLYSPPTLCRPASNLETFFVYMNEFKVYSNFGIIGEYSTNQLQNRSILFRTLRSLILQNTVFTLNFFQDDPKKEKWVLRPIDEIKYEDVVEYISVPEKINDSFAAKLSEDYWFDHNVQKPLWKIIVLNESSIVFLANHSLFDGESGVQFHLEFVKELNLAMKSSSITSLINEDEKLNSILHEEGSFGSISTTNEEAVFNENMKEISEVGIKELDIPESTFTKQKTFIKENSFSSVFSSVTCNDDNALFKYTADYFKLDSINPAGEKIIDHKPTFKHMVCTLFNEKFIPKFPKLEKLKNWLTKSNHFQLNKTPCVPPKSAFKFFNISNDELNKVAKQCHDLKISLTVWITICLQYAFNEIIFDQEKTLESMIAMNTRKFVKNKYKKDYKDLKFGLFVSGYGFNLKPLNNLTQLIPISQKQTINLKKETKKRKGLQTIGTMNYISSIKSLISDHSKTQKKLALAVSNLGFRKTDSLKDSDIYIKDLIFTQGCASNDELVAVSTIATPTGGLNAIAAMEIEFIEHIDVIMDKFFEAFNSIN